MIGVDFSEAMLARAREAAALVGACNVEAADTLSGIRPWDDTMARIARGWPHCELVLASPGWHFDDHYQFWVRH